MVFVSSYLNVPDALFVHYQAGLADLIAEAHAVRPHRPGEFTRHAAAVHEASHCVIAKIEGKKPKYAAIWREGDDWVGENFVAGKTEEVDFLQDHDKALAYFRITLAGRRGELLFEPEFCPRAGLDELAYVLTVIMIVIKGMGLDPLGDDYFRVWGTQLAEIDEGLRRYERVVREIADRLIRFGSVDRKYLTKALASVEKRKSPPPIRTDVKLDPPFDPLDGARR